MAGDLDRLQGRWRIAALEMNGLAVPAAMIAAAEVALDGDGFTSSGMGATYVGRIALNEAETPKRITLSFEAGPEAGRANHGIYEITGDGWRFCLNMMGGPAPSAFTTKPGDGCALQSFARS